MNLKQYFLTNNGAYKAHQKHAVKGIMVHSTGANNPWLKRLIAPDDGTLGRNEYNNHWNQDQPIGTEACAHAVIGKRADGSIATYQALPWDIAGWHSGPGWLGTANYMGWIGFEIMEDRLDDPVYFAAVYQEAVELTAYLCRFFSLDAMTAVKSHSEGFKVGIASNHSDPEHWFSRFGKNMVTFRDAVKKQMIKNQKEVETMPEIQRYQTIEEVPEQYRSQVEGYVKAGIISGKPDGLDVTEDMIRTVIYQERLSDLKFKQVLEKLMK